MNKSVAEMELEKYRRAIRSSVSALGYRELKKEEEIILRFISDNQHPILRLIPTLEALLKKKPSKPVAHALKSHCPTNNAL